MWGIWETPDEIGGDVAGYEVWVCEHPEAARSAYEAAEAAAEEAGLTEWSHADSMGLQMPLDAAADAGGEAEVLTAPWGNDIPSDEAERASWLVELLRKTRQGDRARVQAEVEARVLS